MNGRCGAWYVRSMLVLLIALNLCYAVGVISLLTSEGVAGGRLYESAVSAFSQQLGWIVVLALTVRRLEHRLPILIAVVVSMVSGNALCSYTLWIQGHGSRAVLNSVIGLVLSGFVVLAAVIPVNIGTQSPDAR